MAENKRYYWLKLHEEFFNQPVMKLIRKMPDGEKVLIIYLKLLLISLRTGGYIYLEGLLPAREDEIALVLDEDVMFVKYSVKTLEGLKLLEIGSGEWDLYMPRFPEMVGVGSETAAASRMRAMRERKGIAASERQALPEKPEGASHCYTPVTPRYADVRSCYTEKDKEKDKEKESETEKNGEADSEKDAAANGPYGVSRNVYLTPAELASLQQQFPDYLAKIDYFSSYMAATGRKYDNHYLTICQWAKKDEARRPKPEAKKSGFEDYSFQKGESY